jgi:hypothetical protein
MARLILDSERKMVGPDDAQGRLPIVEGLFVGREACGWGGGHWWPSDSRLGCGRVGSLVWVVSEGGFSMGCREGGWASTLGRGR